MQRFCFWFSAILCAVSTAFAAEPEKSVVQIMNFSQQPVWDAPWRFDSVRRSSGTGFVISKKRIMTNAHVVSWAKQILVRRYQDPKPYLAKVQFIGHDCDLAVLSVEDESFFEGLDALPLGSLPKVRSTVVTYGYPAGGEQISYTRGVVSRIEMQSYVHIGNRSLLTVQTDAAINPGNSGGPVIQDDQVVGVAFQGAGGLENTGYFIPPQVVQHFLKDIEDGTYHGFPQAGVRLVALQNPAYRRYLKVPSERGARIDGLLNIPTTEAVIKPDDVLLQVGPYEVGSDGTILFSGNRLGVSVAFQEAQHGESVPLRIWRNGAEVQTEVPVKVYQEDKNTGNIHDALPRYYIHGGLVFTPLSHEYLKTFGRNWADSANNEVIYELYYRRGEMPKLARREPIMLATVLAHPVNSNIGIKSRVMINKINGKRIDRLEDVIEAFESGTKDQHLIEFLPDNSFECIDRAGAKESIKDILKNYGIAEDRRL